MILQHHNVKRALKFFFVNVLLTVVVRATTVPMQFDVSPVVETIFTKTVITTLAHFLKKLFGNLYSQSSMFLS